MSDLCFDGCGINLEGRRILTGAREDWDKPEFQALCKVMAASPSLLAALRPFADLLEFPDEFPDEFFDCRVSVDDIKAAVAAIAKAEVQSP